MEVGFAGDDGAGGAELLDEPGILARCAVQVAVKVGSASGGGPGEIEAVFYGDGNSPKRGTAVAEIAAFAARSLRDAIGFSESPCRVAPQIGVAAQVAVGAGEGPLGQSQDLGFRGRCRQSCAKGKERMFRKAHGVIVIRRKRNAGQVNFAEANPRPAVLSSIMVEREPVSRSRNLTNQIGLDEERMAALAAFTARSQTTDRPVPFGCAIVETYSGNLLIQARNAVAREFDPSAHAEVRAIRLATKRLKSISLAGYTLYTTCEPCPMCMSAALWAGVDRVVYGATIEDCNRHCRQIQIPAMEVAGRSDMRCIVDGPVLREACYALFTHPRMLRAFSTWSTGKEVAAKS